MPPEATAVGAALSVRVGADGVEPTAGLRDSANFHPGFVLEPKYTYAPRTVSGCVVPLKSCKKSVTPTNVEPLGFVTLA